MNKGEAALIILIGLLFIGCVLVVSDLQTKEEALELVIINETYEPKYIHGRPIVTNRSTVLSIEERNNLKDRQFYINNNFTIPVELQLKGIDDKTLEEISKKYN